MGKFAVVLPAAGKSSRFGDPFTKKVYANIDSKPVWMYAAEAFAKRADVAQIILVISPEDKEMFNEKFSGNAAMLGIQPVLGGKERADSVLNGLAAVNDGVPFVAVHDAARPCIADAWIDAVFETAQKTQAAILAVPCTSTLKRVDEQQQIVKTESREQLWLAQTPQVFATELLSKAYTASENVASATDEASLVEALGQPVAVVQGSPMNIKVTSKSDLRFAELALKALPKPKAFPFG